MIEAFTSIQLLAEVGKTMRWRGNERNMGLLAGFWFCLAFLLAAHPASAHLRHHLRHVHHVALRHALGAHYYHSASYRRAGHYRHYYRPAAYYPEYAPPSAGFGPTSPGASSIVVDAANGRVITAEGADVPRYPASLTKLMTLDLAFQALQAGRMTLDTQIPVSYHAAAVEPVKLGLRSGSTLSVRQAILAMTTMSANDAATALGEYLGGGSEVRCAQMMTLRAHALGMAQTQFYNASGLPNPGQVTTARDLSILARDIVVSFPNDQSFFEVQEFDFNGRPIYSNNGMLKMYPGATGMKTGYTDLARHNLVTSAERNGQILIGVVLHEPSWGTSYGQMTAMLDDGFGGHIGGPNMMVASNQPPAMVQHHAVARATAGDRHAMFARNWTAQLGLFRRLSQARIVAFNVRRMRGVGVARIARVERHGRTLWTAQLAGLTLTAAHETCNAVAARGDSCRIIAPSSAHLAMAGSVSSGLGT